MGVVVLKIGVVRLEKWCRGIVSIVMGKHVALLAIWLAC